MPKHGWLVALSLVCVLGCRQPASQSTPVSGRVLYRGSALRSGQIVFTPDAQRGHNGEMAMGSISFDGSYSLRTGETVGVAPGWYKVTVASLMSPGGGSFRVGEHSFAIPVSAVPEKYRDPSLSKLACEVKAGQPNVINFDLD